MNTLLSLTETTGLRRAASPAGPAALGHYDVVVIGAGQAGLAVGYHLRNTGLSFVLLERHARVGASWRNRYDSLTLFSSRRYSALPGLGLVGDPEGFPAKDEIAGYLEAYAATFALSVRCSMGVESLERSGGGFVLRTLSGHTIWARAVIVATGAFQRSRMPSFARKLSSAVIQLPAEQYCRPDQVPRGRVLVVGGGATGRQIARELVSDRSVWLSVGRGSTITPARIFGRDILHWYHRIGALTADKESLYGRLVRLRDAFPGLPLRTSALRRAGVRVVARSIDGAGTQVRFANGETESFHAVIWAAGYRDDPSWLRIPEAVREGRFAEERGVSPVPGLFYIGRHWQNSRSSALLCGVGRDAASLVATVTRWLRVGAQVGGNNDLGRDR